MIHTNRIVTVGEQESIIDRPVVLYRGDREVEIEFTLVGNEFTFSEDGNVIKSVNASHGQLVLNTPSGEHMFSELAECHEGKVVFVVTKEMIDEFVEVGFYSFQIRLYDSAEMKSRVTIPPVMNGFDIRNPIAAEDEANVVDQGIVDYARIFKDQSNEELPTFDWTGAYNKTEWAHHDVITENKMNKIEDALYSINANIKESDVVMLNTLDKVKKDADKYIKEHIAEVEADVEEFERNINTDVQQFKIDTNAAMTAHKNEVSEVVDGFSGEIESINSQLAHIATIYDDNYIINNNTLFKKEEYILDANDIVFEKNIKVDGNGASINRNENQIEGRFLIQDNTVIKNFNFKNSKNVLWIMNKSNIIIENCSFENIGNVCIYVYGCNNVTIKNCKFNNNTKSSIIVDNESANILIENNIFDHELVYGGYSTEQSDCAHVYCLNGDNIRVINNIVRNSGGQGIIFGMNSNTKKGVTNSIAMNNYCEGNGQEGITNFGILSDKNVGTSTTNNNKVIGNTCINNRFHQIEVWNADNILVSNNIVIEKDNTGSMGAITVYGSSSSFITQNKIQSALGCGIMCNAGSEYCVIDSNIISNFNIKQYNTSNYLGNAICLDSNSVKQPNNIKIINNIIEGNSNTEEKNAIYSTSNTNANNIIENNKCIGNIKDIVSYSAKMTSFNYITSINDLDGKTLKNGMEFILNSADINTPTKCFVKINGKGHKKSYAKHTYQNNTLTNVTNIDTWNIGDVIKSTKIQNGVIASIDTTNNTLTITGAVIGGGDNIEIYDAYIKEI